MASADSNDKFQQSAVLSGDEREGPLDDSSDSDYDGPRTDILEFEPVRRGKPKRKRFFRKVAVVVGLLVVSAATWMIWGNTLTGSNPNEMPVVRAPIGPIKVRPERPGGISIPNRDKLVYDRLEKKPPERKAETLLPKPEKPLPAPRSSSSGTIRMPMNASGLENILRPVSPGQTAQSAEQAVPPAPITPKPPTTDSEESPKAAGPKATKLTNSVQPRSAKVKPASGVSQTKTFQVQLAAVRDKQGAIREWKRLKARSAKLLGGLKPSVVRANLGSRGVFYRLRAGPISGQVNASKLCKSLSQLKVGCIVIQPGG